MPATHAVQAVARLPLTEPTVQFWQATVALAVNVPALQEMQAVALDPVAYDPEGHVWHDTEVLVVYVPGVHVVHWKAPPRAYEPAEQAPHAVLFTVPLNVPEPQFWQGVVVL